MNYLVNEGKLKFLEEVVSSGNRSTEGGDDNYQLLDILKEKDQVIELLTKEKNYYLKRNETM